jgi:hypothetical protein
MQVWCAHTKTHIRAKNQEEGALTLALHDPTDSSNWLHCKTSSSNDASDDEATTRRRSRKASNGNEASQAQATSEQARASKQAKKGKRGRKHEQPSNAAARASKQAKQASKQRKASASETSTVQYKPNNGSTGTKIIADKCVVTMQKGWTERTIYRPSREIRDKKILSTFMLSKSTITMLNREKTIVSFLGSDRCWEYWSVAKDSMIDAVTMGGSKATLSVCNTDNELPKISKLLADLSGSQCILDRHHHIVNSW